MKRTGDRKKNRKLTKSSFFGKKKRKLTILQLD